MYLSSISSSFLTFQFDHSDTANLRTLLVSRTSFWTALRVVYGFVQVKALKLGVPSTIVHPAPCCGRHCFYMRCC